MKRISKAGEVRLLIRCPVCKRENYSANVYSGNCTWCLYSAHYDKDYKPQ